MAPEEPQNSLESNNLSAPQEASAAGANWLRLGAVAAVSVLAGGLAAAWWYKKAVKQLRQAEEDASNPHYGICGDDPSDEP